jgi:thiol-disulfide isomerase/thioredoxin
MRKQFFLILTSVFLTACNGNPGGSIPDSDTLPVEREQFMTDCPISGTNVTKDFAKVAVYRPDQSCFRDDPVATFQVKKGRLAGAARLDTTLVYELVFSVPKSGMAMVRPFVPTAVGVKIVGPESLEAENIELVSASPENENFNRYADIGRSMAPLTGPLDEKYWQLAEENALYNDAVNALVAEATADTTSRERSLELWAEINRLQKLDESYSAAGLAVKRERDAIRATIDSLAGAFLAEHPSVSSFYLVYQHVQSAFDFKNDLQPWIDLYDRAYADRFPDHPYHAMILSLTGNRVGDPIRDFTLPDAKGVQRTLSDLTAGKVAVVDFWASWCGSCRIRSKALIPIYQKYAGEDFTVVGVALEYKNDAAWRKALDKDGYPWINLLALDAPPSLKANHAKAFLLDRDGTILAIDPTVEELDAQLQDLLHR